MNEYGQQPYTYLIRCIPTGQIYYGVRYGNRVKPEEDLWVKYFTSSKRVKELIQTHGKTSFDFEVRKVFESTEAAIDWERRVLERSVFTEMWLNRNVAGAIKMSAADRSALSRRNKGRRLSDQHKAAISASKVGKPRSAETRAKLSAAQLGRKRDPEVVAKLAETAKLNWSTNTDRKKKLTERNLQRWSDPAEKQRHIALKCKQYVVTDADGLETVVTNLTEFALAHNLGRSSLHSAKATGKRVGGFLVRSI